MFLGECVFAWRGRDSASSSAWFGSGATKGGWVMAKWRWTSVHDLKNDAKKVRSATMWLQLIPIATPPPSNLFTCNNQHPTITSMFYRILYKIIYNNHQYTSNTPHHMSKFISHFNSKLKTFNLWILLFIWYLTFSFIYNIVLFHSYICIPINIYTN